MKIFVWRGEGILQDWTSGMAVAIANSVEEARDAVLADLREEHKGDLRYTMDHLNGIQKDPEIFEINGPLGFHVFGGA